MADTLSDVQKASLSGQATATNATKSAETQFNSIGRGIEVNASSGRAGADDVILGIFTGGLFNAIKGAAGGYENAIVGLETEQIPTMKNAIDDYVDNVMRALEPLNASDAQKAFGNVIQGKIQEFVMSIKKACTSLTSTLYSFKDDLDEIKAKMEAKAQDVNTSVGKTTDDLTSAASSWSYSGNSR